MKREELEVVTLDEIAQDLVEDQVQPDEYYVKEETDSVMDAMEARIKELEKKLPKWKVLSNLVPKNKYLKFLSVKRDGKPKVNVGYVREGMFGVDVVLLNGASVVSESFNELKGKIFYLEETLPPIPTTEESTDVEKEK